MRPRTPDELVGQRSAVGPDTFLGRILRGESPPRSCILWGPPGSGKTTIAGMLGRHPDYTLVQLSAVLSGVRDLREALQAARDRRGLTGRGTILFVDEIHRFNKAQQDAFLPHVEAGDIVLIGATTENPSFEVISPLLSRCRVTVLEALQREDLDQVLSRALEDEPRGLGAHGLSLDDEARSFLVESGGDARAMLGGLEAAADAALAAGRSCISLEDAEAGLQKRALLYDRNGEQHYDVVSALIKSLRASSVDGALYWLARMIEGGEDPMFIARRLVIFASEDIGLADPVALGLAVAARDGVHFVGMPEARIILGQAAAYLALAPKSNASYRGINAALAEVRNSGALPVPLHLRNAPTGLMRDLNYGKDYVYAHDDPEGAAKLNYLPEQLDGQRFFPGQDSTAGTDEENED